MFSRETKDYKFMIFIMLAFIMQDRVTWKYKVLEAILSHQVLVSDKFVMPPSTSLQNIKLPNALEHYEKTTLNEYRWQYS